MKNKTQNQINVIFPYKKNRIWVFDDPDVGLEAEPFVGNINQMIDMHLQGDQECTIYLSKDPIKDANVVLTNVDNLPPFDKDDEFLTFMKGNYQLDGTDMIGWLCPATLNYFEDYPKKIYARIERNA